MTSSDRGRELAAALSLLGQGYRRYSADALPAYRFLPGLTPHPLTDSGGHSLGRGHGAVETMPPAEWAGNGPYLFGCDLYNRGYWWEAHEAWEALWQGTRLRIARGEAEPDEVRQHRFLQGLIQAANAQLKLALGRVQAVSRLWEKAEAHWQGAGNPRHFMGLDLAGWRRESALYLERRLAESPLRHDPAGFPLIHLHHFADLDVVEKQKTHYSA